MLFGCHGSRPFQPYTLPPAAAGCRFGCFRFSRLCIVGDYEINDFCGVFICASPLTPSTSSTSSAVCVRGVCGVCEHGFLGKWIAHQIRLLHTHSRNGLCCVLCVNHNKSWRCGRGCGRGCGRMVIYLFLHLAFGYLFAHCLATIEVILRTTQFVDLISHSHWMAELGKWIFAGKFWRFSLLLQKSWVACAPVIWNLRCSFTNWVDSADEFCSAIWTQRKMHLIVVGSEKSIYGKRQ